LVGFLVELRGKRETASLHCEIAEQLERVERESRPEIYLKIIASIHIADKKIQ
jgi:hypothetical protein